MTLSPTSPTCPTCPSSARSALRIPRHQLSADLAAGIRGAVDVHVGVAVEHGLDDVVDRVDADRRVRAERGLAHAERGGEVAEPPGDAGKVDDHRARDAP